MREALVRGIYSLIDNPQEWHRVIELMDQFGESSDLLQSYPDGIASLLPHLEHSIQLMERISELEIKNSHADKLINHLPMGILTIKSDATLLSANKHAKELLDHLQVSHKNGLLKFRKMVHQKAFQLAVREISNDQPSVFVTMGELSLWISSHGHAGEFLVFLSGGSSYCRNIQIPKLIEAYGLTAKEAELTRKLCDDQGNIETAAGILNITTSTARSHLKQVFAKIGVRSQADLVKKILNNPALVFQEHSKTIPVNTANRTTQMIRLSSGRTISWAEYGDPEGRPVVLCHALTGCRLSVPSNEKQLKKYRLRLIVPDRAGYGFSTPASTDIEHQWLEDMRLFLPAIGASNCTLIGHANGGAHAIKWAILLPEMVNRLCLVSSIVPLLQEDDMQDILPIKRMLFKLVSNNRVAAKGFLKLAFKAGIKKPTGYMELFQDNIPYLDREMIDDPEIMQLLLNGFAETTRQGVEHMVDELLYIAESWRLDPKDIRCPVSIWHGRKDKHAPIALMQKFSKTLPENPATHWVKNSGHYMLFYRWSDIIKDISQNMSEA